MPSKEETGLTKFTKKILKRNAEDIPLYAFGPLPAKSRAAYIKQLARQTYSEDDNER